MGNEKLTILCAGLQAGEWVLGRADLLAIDGGLSGEHCGSDDRWGIPPTMWLCGISG